MRQPAVYPPDLDPPTNAKGIYDLWLATPESHGADLLALSALRLLRDLRATREVLRAATDTLWQLGNQK